MSSAKSRARVPSHLRETGQTIGRRLVLHRDLLPPHHLDLLRCEFVRKNLVEFLLQLLDDLAVRHALAVEHELFDDKCVCGIEVSPEAQRFRAAALEDDPALEERPTLARPLEEATDATVGRPDARLRT